MTIHDQQYIYMKNKIYITLKQDVNRSQYGAKLQKHGNATVKLKNNAKFGKHLLLVCLNFKQLKACLKNCCINANVH